MAACYDTKAFRESCPYDQDIILHYEGKVSTQRLGKCPTLQRPSTTLSLPELPEPSNDEWLSRQLNSLKALSYIKAFTLLINRSFKFSSFSLNTRWINFLKKTSIYDIAFEVILSFSASFSFYYFSNVLNVFMIIFIFKCSFLTKKKISAFKNHLNIIWLWVNWSIRHITN